MAASTNPDAYPATFAMIVEHFKDPCAEDICQFYEKSSTAARVRFKFYDFKNALNRTPGRETDSRVAQGVIAKIREVNGGTELCFSLRDNEDWAVGLEQAIMRAKGMNTPQNGRIEPPTAGEQPGVRTSESTHDSLIDGFMKGNAKGRNNAA